MLDGGWTCAKLSTPYYHHTEQGTDGTHLVLVCAWVYSNILPSVHGVTLTPCRSSLGAVGVPHGRRTSPCLFAQRSCDQAEACCAVRIAQATWRVTEQAMISTNRGCLGGEVGPTRPSTGRQGTFREIPARQFMSGVRCGAIHIMGLGARRFRSLELSCRKWSGAASGHHGQAMQWSGPNQSGRFG